MLITSDGQTPPAHLNDIELSFYNQKNNKLDYNMITSDGVQKEAGKGMYITGNGNNFTAFIATNGKAAGIAYKSGVIISGTYDVNGIYNLYWSTVMIDKKDDPNDKLIKKGVYRIFKDKDGWSENCRG